MELANRGNRVFFLDPPESGGSRQVVIASAPEDSRISIVRYRPLFPLGIRFHARRVYDWLIGWQVRAITRAIGVPLDVVWSFDFNLFPDLRAFRPTLTIFHPVDPLSEPAHIRVAHSADAVLAVSEQILASFSDLDVPAFFVNHGLSEPFVKLASSSAFEVASGERPQVGYSGNLLRPPLNRNVFRRVIADHPEAEFHFWGPWKTEGEHRMPDEIADFIAFLAAAPNVQLHGVVSAADLSTGLAGMDCLLLCYSLDPRESDRSNSHKILEYLATGKAIVSSRIATYSDYDDLISMPVDGDDSAIPALFTQTLACLPEANSAELRGRRRKLALENSYPKQVDRIAGLLGDVWESATRRHRSIQA